MNQKCAFCGNLFKKRNGTSRYCPGNSCYKEAKKQRQKVVDDLLKSFRKGIYQNLKLFVSLLPKPGSVSRPLSEMLIKGFDENAFYGVVIDKQKRTWQYVGNYLFNISIENNLKQVNIYKQ
ncbi:hypothetical protein [Lacibacter sp.]|uniref:hypothetical protein n=1 Tax=Lacibacter sp. TaxID=1915409 RepID=UPI002B4B1C29|nr:hypothetical protein [Lacibacter sp.]HLP36955.1 hypothetical protein [Lacibacter sp.]